MIAEAAGAPGPELPRTDVEKLKQEISQPEQFVVNFNYLARKSVIRDQLSGIKEIR
jgi:hypothetical protein